MIPVFQGYYLLHDGPRDMTFVKPVSAIECLHSHEEIDFIAPCSFDLPRSGASNRELESFSMVGDVELGGG